MDRIVLKIHSMVDIITNSSTELFVVDTDKTMDVVKDILEKAIELHNSVNDTEYKFEDIFKPLRIDSGHNAIGGYNNWFTSYIESGIIIRGIGDNTIPWWMFEFIEDTFGKTERFHLG